MKQLFILILTVLTSINVLGDNTCLYSTQKTDNKIIHIGYELNHFSPIKQDTIKHSAKPNKQEETEEHIGVIASKSFVIALILYSAFFTFIVLVLSFIGLVMLILVKTIHNMKKKS